MRSVEAPLRVRVAWLAGGVVMGSALGCAARPSAPALETPVSSQPVPLPTVPTPPPVSSVMPPAAPSCGDGSQPSTQFVRKDWLGAYELLKAATQVWVDGDDPTSPEAAREGLCLGTSGMVGMPPNQKFDCKGAYWVVSTDHFFYTDHTFVIVPRGDEAIVFDAGLIGGGTCTGEQSSSLSSLEVGLDGDVLRVRMRSESFEWDEGASPGQECEHSHTDVAEYSYDIGSDVGCEALHVE